MEAHCIEIVNQKQSGVQHYYIFLNGFYELSVFELQALVVGIIKIWYGSM